LAIWHINKKKPILSHKNAHKEEDQRANTSLGWINTVSACSNSDLMASGSDDGYVRLWTFSTTTNKFSQLFKIEIVREITISKTLIYTDDHSKYLTIYFS
jgi:ribosomal RNA-processing protein 9